MKPEAKGNGLTAREIADQQPLPAWQYVPGKNQRHEEGFLDCIISQSPDEFEQVPQSVPWYFAKRLLQGAYFWEAHEVLEALWMQAPQNSREKSLLQGIIHLANGALKERMGRERAMERLKKEAELCFDRAYQRGGKTLLMGMSRHEVAGLIGGQERPTKDESDK